MKKVKLLSAKKARKIEISHINQEIIEAISIHETEVLIPNVSKKNAKKLKKKGFSVVYTFDSGEVCTIISWNKKEKKKKKGSIECPYKNDFSDIEDYFLGLDDDDDSD